MTANKMNLAFRLENVMFLKAVFKNANARGWFCFVLFFADTMTAEYFQQRLHTISNFISQLIFF